jgi:hypothetical protein
MILIGREGSIVADFLLLIAAGVVLIRPHTQVPLDY